MAKDIRIEFGRDIRSLREQYNLTQEELADKANISTKYLQNLEGKNPKTASIGAKFLFLEKFGCREKGCASPD